MLWGLGFGVQRLGDFGFMGLRLRGRRVRGLGFSGFGLGSQDINCQNSM